MATNSNMKYWQDAPTTPRAADSHLTPEQRTALEGLYPSSKPKPDTAKAERNAPLADRMYGFKTTEEAVGRHDADLFTRTGAGETEQRQLRETFVGFRKAGVPENIVHDLADAHIGHLIGDARPESEAEATASADALGKQIHAWDHETREFLRLEYKQEAEALLARTRRYVASVPQLKTLLDDPRLGSKPEIVKALVAHVRMSGFR